MKIVVLMMSMLLGFQTTKAQHDISGRVTNIVDGNTIEILSNDNEKVVIILSDIDCPDAGQEFSEEAIKFTKKKCLRASVKVKITGRDRSGNMMAKVYLSGDRLLNYEIAEAGYAWKQFRARPNEEVNQLIEQAKEKKLGLWSKTEPTPPWIFRRQQSMLTPKSS